MGYENNVDYEVAMDIEEYIFKEIFIHGHEQNDDGSYEFDVKDMPFNIPTDSIVRAGLCKDIEENLILDIKDADNFDEIVHQDNDDFEGSDDDVDMSYGYFAHVEFDGDILRVNV